MFQRPTAAVSQLHPDRDGGDGLLPGLLSSVRPGPPQQAAGKDEIFQEKQRAELSALQAACSRRTGQTAGLSSAGWSSQLPSLNSHGATIDGKLALNKM